MSIPPINPIPAARPPRLSPREYHLFLFAGAVALALVFAGFARSYYLRAFFGMPSLSSLLHLHGALMTSWFVLFFVQTCLIEAHRADLHRKLGIFGAVLATLIVPIGAFVIFHTAAREVLGHTKRAHFFLIMLGIDGIILFLFAGFVTCALAARRKHLDYHKRLMLLATLSLLLPAIQRIPLGFIQSDRSGYVVLGLYDLCVVAAVAIDTFRHRRLHPAFGWGALLLVASMHLALIGVQTQTWIEFATKLVS
jgi:hypothetical protein